MARLQSLFGLTWLQVVVVEEEEMWRWSESESHLDLDHRHRRNQPGCKNRQNVLRSSGLSLF